MKVLCQLLIAEMKIGECVKGVLTRTGYANVIDSYHRAIGLRHDKKQLSNKIRNLRWQAGFIRRLNNDSGLGHNEDGSVNASDDWWERNTQVPCLFCCAA